MAASQNRGVNEEFGTTFCTRFKSKSEFIGIFTKFLAKSAGNCRRWVKDILRLKHQNQLSVREIAGSGGFAYSDAFRTAIRF
jgi:hypothetical protein